MPWLRSVLNWTARGCSAVFAGLMLVMTFGDGGTMSSAREALLLLFFPVGVVAGLAWAWRHPGRGSLLALGSLAVFYLLHAFLSGEFPAGPYFLLFTSPALLFMAVWFMSRNKGRL